ncbi:MAG TPA: hypothetical protein VEP49_20020 [Acidimicrobiia bacterium]|nr:hypothetical protein [Acidimicrobiia bacterium]
MTSPCTARTFAHSLAVFAVAGAALVAVPAPSAGAATNGDAGIGTKAALNGPLCDPTTGRIKIPAYLASVCVKPWPKGADNGGATYQGVTKDSIKVVVYLPPVDIQKAPPGGQPPLNRSTGKPGTIQDAVLDAQTALDGRYELWGRKIDYKFVTYSGTDEASQRADAVAVAAMKPFAVLNIAGGNVFSNEIAKRKIPLPWGSGTQQANLAQQPYRFTGQDADLQAKNVATWLGREIANHKAQWAGDPSFQKETRKLGVVFQSSVVTGDEFNTDKFNAELAKQGVAKPAVEAAYTAPADTSTSAIQSAAQDQAPVIVAKLKSAGVTSVVLMASTSIIAPMTKAATANDYHPEWVMTGWAYQELTLFAAQYDPDQWAHAFGMSWFAPYASDNAGAVTAENVVNWYWGTNKATTYSGGMPAVYFLNQGIMLAGPKLTPTSFRDGEFSQPGSGGAFQGQVTTQGNKVGDLGLGYPEYALLGPKDFALVWWDPKAEGLGNILGNKGTGNYEYLDGGKRYTLQTWPKGEPKFFQHLSSNVVSYSKSPAKDLPPQYPCTGCPSQGGAQEPSNFGS